MSDRRHDPDSEDPEERAIARLRDVCDAFEGVVELRPSLAPHFSSLTQIYAGMSHGAHRTEEGGYDWETVFASISELANTYRNALFALLFALQDADKAKKALSKEKEMLTPLEAQRVRTLLADLLQLQIDGNVSLDELRALQAEARSLLTGEAYRPPHEN